MIYINMYFENTADTQALQIILLDDQSTVQFLY